MVEQMTNETVQNEGEKKWKKYLKYLPIFLVLAAIMVYCIVIFVSDKPDDKKPASNTTGNKTSEAGPTEEPTEAPKTASETRSYTAREFEVLGEKRLMVGSRTVKFDEQGRLVSQTDEDDLQVTVRTFSYDSLGRIDCVTIVVTQLDDTKTKDAKILITYHEDTDIILEETRYDFGELTGSLENAVAFGDVVTSSKWWMKGEEPQTLIEFDPTQRLVISNQYSEGWDDTPIHVEYKDYDYYDVEGRLIRTDEYTLQESSGEFVKDSWTEYQYFPDSDVCSGFQGYTNYGPFSRFVYDEEGRLILIENNTVNRTVYEWEDDPFAVDGSRHTEYYYETYKANSQADLENVFRRNRIKDADTLMTYLGDHTYGNSVLIEGMTENGRIVEDGEHYILTYYSKQFPEHSGLYYADECFESVDRRGLSFSDALKTEYDDQGRRVRRVWSNKEGKEIVEEYDEHGNMKRSTLKNEEGETFVTEWDYEYFE